MKSYIIDLLIPYDEMHRYYAGQVSSVQATTRDGISLRFDARHLRQFLTPTGIRGTFKLVTDDNNRFISLERQR